MQISFVKSDKIQLTKSIEPNVIHNRYDLLYGNDYDLLKIEEGNSVSYIPFKKTGQIGCMGLYLRDMKELAGGGTSVAEYTSFLFKTYPDLQDIFVLHTYVPLPDVEPAVHWHVDMPKTIEAFDATLSSKVRYNTKWYPKKIRENIGSYEIKILKSDECPEFVVKTYLKWKKETYGFNWSNKPKEYLTKNGITDVYFMQVNEEILAIGFICDTGENAFFENTAFNEKYKKYSAGIVLYHFIIDDLIKKRKKKLFLLGGDLEYKRHYNGIQTVTYTGHIYRDPEMRQKVLKIAQKFKALPLPKKLKKKLASLYGRFFLSPYYKQYLKMEVMK